MKCKSEVDPWNSFQINLVKPIEDPLKHFHRLHSMASLKLLWNAPFPLQVSTAKLAGSWESSISLNILDFKVRYVTEFWWNMAQVHVYVQGLTV